MTFFFFLVPYRFALDAEKLKFPSVCENLSRVRSPLDAPARREPRRISCAVQPTTFSAVEEMLCEERRPCLCSTFTSHPLCVRLPRTWAITAYYGDNYLGYNLSYFLRKTSTALCEHHGATGGKKKNKDTKCRFLVERAFDGKRLAHHISHNNQQHVL